MKNGYKTLSGGHKGVMRLRQPQRVKIFKRFTKKKLFQAPKNKIKTENERNYETRLTILWDKKIEGAFDRLNEP